MKNYVVLNGTELEITEDKVKDVLRIVGGYVEIINQRIDALYKSLAPNIYAQKVNNDIHVHIPNSNTPWLLAVITVVQEIEQETGCQVWLGYDKGTTYFILRGIA